VSTDGRNWAYYAYQLNTTDLREAQLIIKLSILLANVCLHFFSVADPDLDPYPDPYWILIHFRVGIKKPTQKNPPKKTY
jgi:hypothetical protein